MTPAEFWRLTSRIDQEALADGDDNAAVAPLVASLSALPVEEIQAYEEELAHRLHDLDGEEFARHAGASGSSGDGFLYCRCFVVAKGKAFYESVLADPREMPSDI